MVKSQEVSITFGAITLQGLLTVPNNAQGIVLFAHGSGSGRLSPRNQFVANTLVKGGIAALLLDLLTPEEEEIDEITRHFRFDIPLLAERLVGATEWVKKQDVIKKLSIGYFGASTGAAAALIAAGEKNTTVKAVVSRGGRPDLAKEALPYVKASTLLIVGASDFGVIELNEMAYDLLQSEKKLELVPHATHLFEEPGTLEIVSHLALDWFIRHL